LTFALYPFTIFLSKTYAHLRAWGLRNVECPAALPTRGLQWKEREVVKRRFTNLREKRDTSKRAPSELFQSASFTILSIPFLPNHPSQESADAQASPSELFQRRFPSPSSALLLFLKKPPLS